MLDFSAYLAAQHLTQEAVNQSLPAASPHPERESAMHRTGVDAALQWIGLSLRHLADVVLPTTFGTAAAPGVSLGR